MSKPFDLRQLQLDLSKNKPSSLYLIHGEEYYLVEEAVRLIREKYLEEGGAIDFNFDQFYASEEKSSSLRDAVETLPMMCPRRLVILKQAQVYKEKDWTYLLPILEAPVSSAIFVIVSEKVDKRKKFYKSILKSGTVVEMKKPFENQMAPWVSYMAHQNELQLTSSQVATLQQMVGTNLSDINSELKKLKQYMGSESQVTDQILKNVVSRVKVETVFELTDALGRRDRQYALKSLQNLLLHGQSEVGILMLMARHIRILLSVKREQNNNTPFSKMVEVIGTPQFFLKKYISQSGLWSEGRLIATFDGLHQTDKMLKSSPVPAKRWLESFIINACM